MLGLMLTHVSEMVPVTVLLITLYGDITQAISVGLWSPKRIFIEIWNWYYSLHVFLLKTQIKIYNTKLTRWLKDYFSQCFNDDHSYCENTHKSAYEDVNTERISTLLGFLWAESSVDVADELPHRGLKMWSFGVLLSCWTNSLVVGDIMELM